MQEYLITEESLFAVSYLIPEVYQKMLRSGELVGTAVLDDWHEGEVIGVVLCKVRNEWMDIVWFCVDENYRREGYAGRMLESCIARAKRSEMLWGAFADIPEGDLGEAVKRIFRHLDFSILPVTQNVYTAALGEIKKNPLFHSGGEPKGMKHIVPLQDAEDGLKQKLFQVLQEDERAVPLDSQSEWEWYDGQLSGIYCTAEGKPEALLLIAKNGDHLTVECAWTQNPGAFILLLKQAVSEACRKYPEDMEIHVPTINETSAKLAEKILPNAVPAIGMQARKMFG